MTGRGHLDFVSLAWWTDAVGRRHVRVEGESGREHRGASPPLPNNEDPRPPLAHVYPDRLFRRQRAGVDVWLAACACGATGLPEALAWMGPCCGPCHDRRQEQDGAHRAPADIPTTFTSSTGAETVLLLSGRWDVGGGGRPSPGARLGHSQRRVAGVARGGHAISIACPGLVAGWNAAGEW